MVTAMRRLPWSGRYEYTPSSRSSSTSRLFLGAMPFNLQFAATTTGPWTDVGGIGSAVQWRGYDNLTSADGDETFGNKFLGECPDIFCALLSTGDVEDLKGG